MKRLVKVKSIDVNKGARLDAGMTPLLAASWHGHEGCVRELLKAPGIDVVRTRDVDGASPLMVAAGLGHGVCVRMIQDKMRELEEEAQRELDRVTCKFCGVVNEWCPCRVPGWMERRGERVAAAVQAVSPPPRLQQSPLAPIRGLDGRGRKKKVVLPALRRDL